MASALLAPVISTQLPEEDDTFVALRRAVQRAKGFTLFVAVCNEPVRRDRLMDRLAESLDFDMSIVRIDKVMDDVLGEVDRNSEDRTRAVSVVGMELGVSGEEIIHPRIALLNHQREKWRCLAPFPVVLWIPEYLLAIMARRSPDFMNWRAGTFLFPSANVLPIFDSSPSFDEIWRLTADDRRTRIRDLEELISRSTVESSGQNAIVVRWQLEVVRHLIRLGEVDRASQILNEELRPKIDQDRDPFQFAQVMCEIADVLKAQGQVVEALRIRREEELPVYERLGDVQAKAATMGKIADVLQAQGQVDEALRIRREEELPVYERLGDVREKAVTMGKIADVLQTQGQVDEALRIRREEELPVYKRLGDVRMKAICHANIGINLIARGKTGDRSLARKHFELALIEARKIRIPEVKIIEGLLRDLDEG